MFLKGAAKKGQNNRTVGEKWNIVVKAGPVLLTATWICWITTEVGM